MCVCVGGGGVRVEGRGKRGVELPLAHTVCLEMCQLLVLLKNFYTKLMLLEDRETSVQLYT